MVETSVHIVYPKTGITFSQFKKVLSVFEEGCKLYGENCAPPDEGRILKVESGSIWLNVILPIAIELLPYFVSFISKKINNKRNKKKMQIEIYNSGTNVKIIIEE